VYGVVGVACASAGSPLCCGFGHPLPWRSRRLLAAKIDRISLNLDTILPSRWLRPPNCVLVNSLSFCCCCCCCCCCCGSVLTVVPNVCLFLVCFAFLEFRQPRQRRPASSGLSSASRAPRRTRSSTLASAVGPVAKRRVPTPPLSNSWFLFFHLSFVLFCFVLFFVLFLLTLSLTVRLKTPKTV